MKPDAHGVHLTARAVARGPGAQSSVREQSLEPWAPWAPARPRRRRPRQARRGPPGSPAARAGATDFGVREVPAPLHAHRVRPSSSRCSRSNRGRVVGDVPDHHRRREAEGRRPGRPVSVVRVVLDLGDHEHRRRAGHEAGVRLEPVFVVQAVMLGAQAPGRARRSSPPPAASCAPVKPKGGAHRAAVRPRRYVAHAHQRASWRSQEQPSGGAPNAACN